RIAWALAIRSVGMRPRWRPRGWEWRLRLWRCADRRTSRPHLRLPSNVTLRHSSPWMTPSHICTGHGSPPWLLAAAFRQMAMTPKQRIRLSDLDLSVIDPFERTTQYIYDEIFTGANYDHPQIKLPEQPTIIDVGANIGLLTIWAARKHRPRTILAYEASPTTHECLIENVARHVDREMTGVACFNLAVSREAGQELVLHQPPWVSGLSTVLDGSTLPWINELRDKGELH